MFYNPDGTCTGSSPTGFYEMTVGGTKVSKDSCTIALLEDGTSVRCVRECPVGTDVVKN